MNWPVIIGVLGIIVAVALLWGLLVWAATSEELAQADYYELLMERRAAEHRANLAKRQAIVRTNRWIAKRAK